MTLINDREKLLRVNDIASSLVREMLRDCTHFDEKQLKNAVENLSRSLVTLTNIQLGLEEDSNEALQATLSKVRIAYNSVSTKELKNLVKMI